MPGDNKNTNRIELLVQVCKMYYIYNLGQSEIARRIGLSRSYVSKLLTEAREMGLVKIEIMDPVNTETFFERKLRDYFGLKKVIVVPKMPGNNHSAPVGKAAADYLGTILKSGDTIGTAWGETIYSCVTAITPRHDLEGVTTLQLCGGISNTKRNIYVSEISQEMTSRIGSTGYILNFPAIVSSQETKAGLDKEQSMIDVMTCMEKANIILITVGAWGENSSPIARAGYLSDREVAELTEKGAVGDIFTHIIDKDGNIVDPELDARTVAVPLDKVKSVETRIFVAFGSGKVAGILAALAGGIPSVFITNEETAEIIQAVRPDIFK